jgi:hypothetical protein
VTQILTQIKLDISSPRHPSSFFRPQSEIPAWHFLSFSHIIVFHLISHSRHVHQCSLRQKEDRYIGSSKPHQKHTAKMTIKRQSVFVLVACLVGVEQQVHSFVAPNKSSLVRTSPLSRQYAISLEKETITDNSSRGDEESPRLTKAKRLLKQLGEDKEESLSSKGGAIKIPYNSADQSAKSAVPDNLWQNGLLDGSDYVTRYAFRRGVKVAEPLVKYDPVAAEKLLFRQPTKWVVRNVQIAFPFGLWAAGVITDYVFQRKSNKRRQRATQLLKAISGLGPAIIKAGQALASRPDLLPSEYLEELQKLQDDVPRFSNRLAFGIVEEELGVKFEDVFELVQEQPVAAASIGTYNVYRYARFKVLWTRRLVCFR